MADTDTLLAEISDKLGKVTEAYVRLEVTTRTETTALREDLADMRSLLRDATRTLSDHSERLTAGETRIHALRDDSALVSAHSGHQGGDESTVITPCVMTVLSSPP